MEGRLAIERNHQALQRIVASIIAMTGLVIGGDPSGGIQTIRRGLYIAALSLLRPAEAATRRLIIAMARGIVVKLPPPARPVQTGLVYVSPYGRSGPVVTPNVAAAPPRARAPMRLSLLDPLTRNPFRRRPRRSGPASVPRIWVPGVTEPYRPPVRPLPTRHDLIDAGRLSHRLAVLNAALADMPAQARRFARWRASKQRYLALPLAQQKPGRRIWPIRTGRPPGGRIAGYDPDRARGRNIREIDLVLSHCDALARFALGHDTS